MRVVIIGAGKVGTFIAADLAAAGHEVVIVERTNERVDLLRARGDLDHVEWVVADACEVSQLATASPQTADVFVAVTNAEEANILSSMLAKRLGARKVMALINKIAYAELVEAGTIDIAISPQQITLGTLLAHVRRGDVVKVHSLRRGAAEAIEAVAHGEARESRVVGRRIEEIQLPRGATISAIVRGDEVLMAHHDTMIEADDHVILFIADRRQIDEVERLFEVGGALV